MDKLRRKDFDTLKPGERKCVQVGNFPVAVFNIEGTLHAIQDVCPHMGGPLSDGELEGKVIACPWHGAQFNVESGEVIAGPGKTLRVFEFED